MPLLEGLKRRKEKKQEEGQKKEEELNQQAIIDYEGDDKMASNNTELKIDDDYINSQAEQIAKWACDYSMMYRQNQKESEEDKKMALINAVLPNIQLRIKGVTDN